MSKLFNFGGQNLNVDQRFFYFFKKKFLIKRNVGRRKKNVEFRCISVQKYFIFKVCVPVRIKSGAQVLKSEAKVPRSPPGDWM